MDCKDLVIDGLARVDESLRMALRGLNAGQLVYRPAEHANSIAWLAWHLTRVQDDHIAELIGQPQVWIADRWYARFERPADAHDTGYGHGPTDVVSIAPASPDVLIEYHAAVFKRSEDFLSATSCADMDRVVDKNWDPPVTLGVRLVSVVNDCTQHVGQMAYLRGLIEDRKWLPW